MRFSKHFYLNHFGNLRFICHHSILNQVAQDIMSGLPRGFRASSGRVNVICGIHHAMTLEWMVPGFTLAIQTEQFFDSKGAPLWSYDNPAYIEYARIAAERADAVLDLSECNRALYDELNLSEETKSKIFYGPHIFPRKAVTFDKGKHERYVFCGGIGTRRKEILRKGRSFEIEVVPNDTFGRQLSKLIAPAKGIVNIHNHAGVYTEAPRLLSAYLHGKVVVSEELGPPFEAGIHYCALNDDVSENQSRVYDRFSELVTKKYAFENFIRSSGF